MTQPADPWPAELERVLAAELDRRRATVLAAAPQAGGELDRLVDFVLDGGKRVRPRFLVAGFRTTVPGDPPEPVLRAAAALELIQACALIHDDVLDRSDTRRGRPSTHRAVAADHAARGWSGEAGHFGVSTAILLGDLALAWADDVFVAAAHDLAAWPRVAPGWEAMRTEVLAGQLLDLHAAAARPADPAEQERLASQVNRYKTAAYTVERPLQLGAELAGADSETVAALRDFGVAVGVAFQLRDDLLGVFGDPAVTGKPAGDDLAEGKRTVLVARAGALLGRQDPGSAAELDGQLGHQAGVARAAELIAGSGAVESVETQIDELEATARAALDRRSRSGQPLLSAGARAGLRQLADQVLRRSS